MKILIIEDEQLVAVSLINLVKELEPSVLIEGPIGSVQDATEWLSKNTLPDLILSDIQLSDGISLDIFSDNKPSCPIIFTTAYDEYAIRAFKVNSIDYLLKPIQKEELQAALAKYKKLQEKSKSDVNIDNLVK